MWRHGHDQGRQTEPFMGAPNRGKSFELEEMMLTQWRRGKMVKVRRVADMMGLLQQISSDAA